MSKFITSYFISLTLLVSLDVLWWGVIAKSFYVKQIGFLMADKFNWLAALLFYLVFILGLSVFVVWPNLQTGNIGKAFLLGAFFGLVAVATYDLTSQALVKNWPYLVTIVDVAWGAVLAGGVSAVTVYIMSLIK